MPLFEYLCHHCQDQFELLIRGQEVPVCPQCGNRELEKQWSVVAAHSTQSRSSLPTCQMPSAPAPGCGLPQCGGGFCAGME